MSKKYVIVDLDGTLANVDHRRQYAVDNNWEEFESPENVAKDTPNKELIEILDNLVYRGKKIILLSGRTSDVRAVTEEWLIKNEVLYHHLFMRNASDNRDDTIIKKEMLDGLAEFMGITKDDILCVFDDRDKVVKMWRENNLLTLQVAEGNF